MKISKIVSAALLSVAASSFAYGDLAGAEKKINAYNNIEKAFIHAVETDDKALTQLADASGDFKANDFPNLYALLLDILKELQGKTATDYAETIDLKDSKNNKIGSISLVVDGSNSAVKIANADGSKSDTFKLHTDSTTIKVSKNTTTFIGENGAADEIAKNEVSAVFNSVKEAILENQNKNERIFIDELVKAVTTTATVADFDKLIKVDVAAYKAALDAEIKKFNVGDQAPNKDNKLITLKTNAQDIAKQVENLGELVTGLTASITAVGTSSSATAADIKTAAENLKLAIDTGLKITRKDGTNDVIVDKAYLDGLVADLSTDKKKEDAATALKAILGATSGGNNGTGAFGVANAANTAFAGGSKALADTAKNLSDFINAFTSGKVVEKAFEGLGELTDLKAKFDGEVKKLAEASDKKVLLLGKTWQDVVAQKDKLDDADVALRLAVSSDAIARAVKLALAAGVPLAKQGDKIVDVNFINTKLAETKSSDTAAKTAAEGLLKTILADAKTKTTAAKTELNKSGGAFELANKYNVYEGILRKYVELMNLRNDYTLSKRDNLVLDSIVDTSLNKDTYELFADQDDDNVATLAKSINSSLDQAAAQITKTKVIDVIRHSNELATNTRLAKLSNPFTNDVALAKAIVNLKADSLADNGGSLASVVSEYTNRFKNDNNVWANVLASKANIKDAPNQSVVGFSFGYDRAFDSAIVGAYASIAKANASSSQASTKSNSYELGLYSRYFVDSHELDARISLSNSSNKLKRVTSSGVKSYNTDAKFKATQFGLGFDYGYVVGLGDGLFAKPLVGLEYERSSTNDVKENGAFAFDIKGRSESSLSAKLGVELRKYVSEANYIYLTPSVEAELYKRSADVVASLQGSNRSIVLQNKTKKGTYFGIQTGGEFKLTDNLSTNINFGVKAKSKEQYYNGTLGLRYAF